jgi:hypothetical protein
MQMQNPLLLLTTNSLTLSFVELNIQLIAVTPSIAQMPMTVPLGMVVLLPSNVLLPLLQ